MKIAGQKPEFKPEVIVIPRQSGNIVLYAGPVSTEHLESFDKMFPTPEPPVRVMANGTKFVNDESPEYQAKLTEHGKKRMTYLMLRSLAATPDLVFETADVNKPETWDNLYKELAESFSNLEQNLIFEKVLNANGLNSTRITEATNSFLAGKATPARS